MEKKNKIIGSIIKAAKSLWGTTPIILGTILLVSLILNLITKSSIERIFTGNFLMDPIIGALLGSILAGNPITSYILGGELLKTGISLITVTAFLVSWVTVGIVQIPAESAILGKRFALLRNITSFVLAIIVAILTTLLLEVVK